MTDVADRFTAVLDANVIAGALTRNILLSLAEAGFYRPRWSAIILNEFERYYIGRYEDPEGAAQQRARMEEAFPEALVQNFETLMEVATLPDPDDRHVLATAIHSKAAVIVTDNLRHFPPEILGPFDIEARSLDDFVADILDMAELEAVRALRTMRERFQKPELDAETLIAKIEKLKLQKTAAILYPYREYL